MTINGSIPGPALRFREGEEVSDPGHQPHARAELAALARPDPAREPGRRARPQRLPLDPARPDLHLPLPDPAGRHLLVPFAQRHAGAGGLYGADRDRAGRRAARAGRPRLHRRALRLHDGEPRDDPEQPEGRPRLLQLRPAARSATSSAMRAGSGLGAALKDRFGWGRMRMDPTDIADVTGYTFLVNGKPAAANETFLFRPGEKVRLRFINAVGHELLRRAHPRAADDRRRRRRPRPRPGGRRRVPPGRGRDLRRHRRAADRAGLHHLRRVRSTAPASPAPPWRRAPG